MTWLTIRGPSESHHVVLHGVAAVPGDKSISHRALMLGALAEGTGRIEGFLPSGDCLATLGCMRQLGVEIEHATAGSATTLIVHGHGLRGTQGACCTAGLPAVGDHDAVSWPVSWLGRPSTAC